jgi:hypothetical protein
MVANVSKQRRYNVVMSHWTTTTRGALGGNLQLLGRRNVSNVRQLKTEPKKQKPPDGGCEKHSFNP